MLNSVLENAWYVWLIPVATVLAHYIKLKEIRLIAPWFGSLRSFAGGFSIGYVFLVLLPELVAFEFGSQRLLWALALLGFAGAHVLHKLIFTYEFRAKKPHEASEEELHLGTAGIYSFLLAFTLAQSSTLGIEKTRWLVVIILVHLVLTELSEFEPKQGHMKLLKMPILLAASCIGVGLALYTGWSSHYSVSLFAIGVGAIIYTAIREEIPADNEGSPLVFMLGILSLSLLVGGLS